VLPKDYARPGLDSRVTWIPAGGAINPALSPGAHHQIARTPQCRLGALARRLAGAGAPALLAIARELTASVGNNVTIDRTVRENVRAQLRVLVKRILRKHGYPPDKTRAGHQTVLEQAAVLSEL
jgi:hypothetical protein